MSELLKTPPDEQNDREGLPIVDTSSQLAGYLGTSDPSQLVVEDEKYVDGEDLLDDIQRLFKLKEDGYVFHGSPQGGIKTLEPRVSNDTRDRSFNITKAVFATYYPEAAIICACMSNVNIPEEIRRSWRISICEGRIVAEIPDTYEPYVTNNVGFVYVLPPSNFHERYFWQCKSSVPVHPSCFIGVSFSDFEKVGGIVVWRKEE